MGTLRPRPRRAPAQLLNLWLLLALLAPAVAAGAGERLELIELQHRRAEELVPVLRPLLGPEEAVSGRDGQLILRAHPQTLERLRPVIRRLDVARHDLRIEVLRIRRALSEAERLEAAARIGADGHGGLALGRAPDEPGLRIEGGRRYETAADGSLHSLRVTEGQSAYIDTGSAVPYPSAVISSGPGGGMIQGGIAYRPLREGFAVLARLHGDQVRLEIEPIAERPDPATGAIERRAAATVISARLGEWILLGGVREDSRARAAGGATRYRSGGREQWYLYLRVLRED